MNSLQFRAILIDPGNASQERPLQIYATSRKEVDKWADGVLASAVAQNAAVQVYQTVETQVAMLLKPRQEPKK